jgi:hypothetical protein
MSVKIGRNIKALPPAAKSREGLPPHASPHSKLLRIAAFYFSSIKKQQLQAANILPPQELRAFANTLANPRRQSLRRCAFRLPPCRFPIRGSLLAKATG